MRQRVATIGLVLFLAVDVVLVALALRPPRTSEPTSSPPTTSSPTTPATSTGTLTTSPTPSRTATSTGTIAQPTPLTLVVNGLDDTVAWRAETGTCDGGSRLAVTRDGGKRWTTVESPASGVARIQSLADGKGFVIGADADCGLAQYTTTDFGASWSDPISISGGWSRTLESDTEALTPANETAQPCGDTAVLDLSRTSAEQAQALCATGEITLTDDGGDSWSTYGQAPGAVALANRPTSDTPATYVARVVASCDGIEVARVAEGRQPARLACVPATVPKEGGRIAISAPDGAGWLVAEDETWTASRDLRTWKKR